LIYALLLIGVAGGTFLLEWLAKTGAINGFVARKATHVLAAVACGAALLLVESSLLIPTGIAATALLWVLVRGKTLLINQALPRQSWGIVFFGLAFTLIATIWDYSSPSVALFALAAVGFADPAAAVLGRRSGWVTFTFSPDEKTLGGWLTFALMIFVAAAITDLVSPTPLFFPLDLNSALFLLYAGMALANVEVLSEGGSDNISLVVYALGLGTAFLIPGHDALHWAITFALSAGVGIFAHRMRFLSFSGALAVYPLAFLIYGLGGWKWTLPIAVFFLLSSALSKIRSRWGGTDELVTEKSGVRDHFQVWANGGIPALIAIASFLLQLESVGYTFYIVAIAASAADTWSTEIGGLWGGKPRHLLTGKKVEKGRSGGVSGLGFLGGFLGAGSVAVTGWLFAPDLGERLLGLMWTVAFLGTLLDSFIGATIQGSFIQADGTPTETRFHGDVENRLVQGWRWVNNDRVNLLSVGLTIVAWLLLTLIT